MLKLILTTRKIFIIDLLIDEIRRELCLRLNQVLFVALAMVHDEELRKFSRNPYFSTMDVTHGTNREKLNVSFLACNFISH